MYDFFTNLNGFITHLLIGFCDPANEITSISLFWGAIKFNITAFLLFTIPSAAFLLSALILAKVSSKNKLLSNKNTLDNLTNPVPALIGETPNFYREKLAGGLAVIFFVGIVYAIIQAYTGLTHIVFGLSFVTSLCLLWFKKNDFVKVLLASLIFSDKDPTEGIRNKANKGVDEIKYDE